MSACGMVSANEIDNMWIIMLFKHTLLYSVQVILTYPVCVLDFKFKLVDINLPDNLPDKASPGETGSASRVTQTEIVYKVKDWL